MPEEAAEAPAVEETEDTLEPDSPEAEAPSEDTPQADDTNWQERYTEAQSWGTKAAQEAAQYRQIIDLARQGDPEALNYLGYEVPEEEEEDEDEPDPDTRIERLEKQLQEQQQERERAAQEAELEQAAQAFYEGEFKKLDPEGEWDDDYRELVIAVADNHLDEDGLPDLKAAEDTLQAQFKARQQALIDSKRNATRPPAGGPGDESLDTLTPQGRHDAILEIAQASQAEE